MDCCSGKILELTQTVFFFFFHSQHSLPRVSRHEVHISGISNDLKEEELSKLISLVMESRIHSY